MNTIAIDCGASFIKAAVFENGEIKKVIQKSSPAVHTNEKITVIEQIPSLVEMVKGIIDELLLDEKEINLCISNEMHGFLLAYKDCTPYTDYISWQKEYGNIEIDGVTSFSVIAETPEFKDAIRLSGMPLRAGLPNTNMLYLKRSGILNECDGALRFFTLGSYILSCISGVIPDEHPTNAAATGLYNVEINDWNRSFIDAIGGGEIEFPAIGDKVMDFEYKGTLVHAYPALGDQQAALLGAGFENQSDLSFNLGTGSQVSLIVDTPQFGEGYQIRPYFFGKYLKTIPHIPSGRALNVYFRFIKSILKNFSCNLSDDEIWKGITDSLSRGDKDCNISVDMSFFENAVSNKTKGQIKNIPEWGFDMDNLIVAIFEQLVDNYISMADRIVTEGVKIKRIVFSGGIARRFYYIRESIMEHYSEAQYTVAENETLLGLYIYSKM